MGRDRSSVCTQATRNSCRSLAKGSHPGRVLQTATKTKKGYKMRIHKLTPIIVSLVVLGVITAALVRYRSVDAQQERAAKAPITAKASLQQTEGGGFNPVPQPEIKS